MLFSLSSTPAEPGIGFRVAGIGDCNGDGVPDLLATTKHGLGFAHSYSGFDSPPSAYCESKANSLGCTPTISFYGVPSLAGDDNFYVRATGELNQRTGLLIWGTQPTNIPFAGGVLCISPQTPIFRGMSHGAGGTPLPNQDCTGSFEASFSHQLLASKGLTAGSTGYAQFISRDPGYPAPNNIGLSNALGFTVHP